MGSPNTTCVYLCISMAHLSIYILIFVAGFTYTHSTIILRYMDHVIARIKEIIDQEGVNQLTFAEKTGINKSTLSHVLTGRNSPSYTVLQKILAAYPYYRHEWLMNGEFPMVKEGYREVQARKTHIPLFTEDAPPSPFSSPTPKEKSETRSEMASSSTSSNIKKADITPSVSRKVEKIIVYYDDNTYQTFTPSDE